MHFKTIISKYAYKRFEECANLTVILGLITKFIRQPFISSLNLIWSNMETTFKRSTGEQVFDRMTSKLALNTSKPLFQAVAFLLLPVAIDFRSAIGLWSLMAALFAGPIGLLITCWMQVLHFSYDKGL